MKHFQVFCILLCLLFAQSSWAVATIEGRILKVGSDTFLHAAGNRMLKLKAGNPVDMNAVKRLESGDFITGTGRIVDGEARMEAVYFVGLQRLLGLWRSRGAEVFEFRTYEDLKLYWPLDPRGAAPVKVKSYSYNVSPSSEANWAMLLVDADSVEMARLHFKARSPNVITVELLDRDTGQVKQSFHLTQIALSQPNR